MGARAGGPTGSWRGRFEGAARAARPPPHGGRRQARRSQAEKRESSACRHSRLGKLARPTPDAKGSPRRCTCWLLAISCSYRLATSLPAVRASGSAADRALLASAASRAAMAACGPEVQRAEQRRRDRVHRRRRGGQKSERRRRAAVAAGCGCPCAAIAAPRQQSELSQGSGSCCRGWGQPPARVGWSAGPGRANPGPWAGAGDRGDLAHLVQCRDCAQRVRGGGQGLALAWDGAEGQRMEIQGDLAACERPMGPRGRLTTSKPRRLLPGCSVRL